MHVILHGKYKNYLNMIGNLQFPVNFQSYLSNLSNFPVINM